MTQPTTVLSHFIASARPCRFGLLLPTAVLLLAVGCGAQTADQAVSSETALPAIASNSFTWGPIDYTVRSASLGESAQGPAVQLDLDATNRIPYGTSSLLDWDLVLADGSLLTQAQSSWFNLEVGQSRAFALQFPSAGAVNLTGAQLVAHQAELHYVPAHIPLDRAITDAPRVLRELVGKVFTTQGAADQTWRVSIASAQVGPNSDVDGGERALFGHQLVDVVFEVNYPATNTHEAYFGADLAAVEVEGAPAYELFDSATLQPNQTGWVHFAFEIAEETTNFVLNVSTNDPTPQGLTIQLGDVLR